MVIKLGGGSRFDREFSLAGFVELHLGGVLVFQAKTEGEIRIIFDVEADLVRIADGEAFLERAPDVEASRELAAEEVVHDRHKALETAPDDGGLVLHDHRSADAFHAAPPARGEARLR